MFTGVFTALVTPFTETGSVDEKALRALVDTQIREGVAGLVPMGTTGESPTLSHEEHAHVIEVVIDQAAGRVPVIAGTGSNSTQEAIDLTAKAKRMGASASLQVAPYYNKPSQEGFYRHFKAIADEVDLPLIIYNIPGRTAKNVETSVIARLAQHPRIVGVKEASGSIAQVLEVAQAVPADFTILSGDDNIVLPIVACGGHGVISVASNIIPNRMVKFVDSCLSGDFAAARKEQFALSGFFQALFFDTNPIPAKYIMSKMGMMIESYRLPMCSMDDSVKARVDAAAKALGLY